MKYIKFIAGIILVLLLIGTTEILLERNPIKTQTIEFKQEGCFDISNDGVPTEIDCE
jgi:hypothetical protein